MSASTVTHRGPSDMFRDPYAQDTIFAAANQPLLSQLFGGLGHNANRDEAADDDGSHITDQLGGSWRPRRHVRDPLRGRFGALDNVVSGLHAAEDARRPITPADRALRVRRWQEDVEAPLAHSQGGTRVAVEGVAATEPDDPQQAAEDAVWLRTRQAAAEEAAKVPFFLQVRETKKRVEEQLAVHRGLNDAMSQLQTLQKQVDRNRREASLTKLLSSLRERQEMAWARVFPDGFPPDTQGPSGAVLKSTTVTPTASAGQGPTTTAASTTTSAAQRTKIPPPPPLVAAASPVTPASNPLKDILEAFSRPRRGDRPASSDTSAGSQATGTTAAAAGATRRASPPKKQLPADVVRAPEEPQPYPVYRYVLRIEEEEETYSNDFSDDGDKDDSVSDKMSEVISDEVSMGVVTEDSVVDDYEAATTVRTTTPDSAVHASDGAASDVSSSIDGGGTPVSESRADTHTGSVDSDPPAYASDSFVSEDDGLHSLPRSVMSSSSIVSESVVETDAGGGSDLGGKVSNATLVATLREFYDACRNANTVAARLTGGVSPALYRHASARSESDGNDSDDDDASTSRTRAKGDDGDAHWQALLKKDVTDVHRLRRFVARLQKNIRAVDVQRKVAAARRKLLLKAQALSKTRARLKQQRTAVLEDVVDSDVEDYFGDSWDSFGLFTSRKAAQKRRRKTGSESDEAILSEIESEDFLGGGGSDDGDGGSSDDDIEDAFGFDFAGSDGSVDDDEIEDEVDDDWDRSGSDARRGSGSGVIDEVGDGAYDDEIFDALGASSEDGVLDEVESEVASRLAAVSDVDDVADLLDELPDNSAVVSLAASSSVRDDVDAPRRVRGSVAADVEDEVDGHHAAAAAAGGGGARMHESSSLPSLSNSSDGDVSSFYPDSLSASRSSHSSIDSSEAAYWESVAGEEALQAMEDELRATKRRRMQALRTVATEVPTFSALYDPTVAPPPPPPAVPSASHEERTPSSAEDTPVAALVNTDDDAGHVAEPEQPVQLFAEEHVSPHMSPKPSPELPPLRAFLVEEVPVPTTVPALPEATTAAKPETDDSENASESENESSTSFSSFSSLSSA